ncbi:hypothetical protein CYFUS_003446 [Cystobacter fuscus]|uniref:Bulb-type lectin domain-containing protein n=1 Tax=Cystobacter fuscus TaxID=43 RepID=A0A250J3C1_9BACT|nr:hypothetical protein [Cystobacter fuscus]ATB38020.1 hypothetical protein CYFUS_003446 [Cystobacter fuscus]
MQNNIRHLAFHSAFVLIFGLAGCGDEAQQQSSGETQDEQMINGTTPGDLTAMDAVDVKANATAVLLPNQGLVAGQSISSSDGRFSLTLRTDGTLVHYWNGHGVLWSPRPGTQGKSVWMQSDGNFVLYSTPIPTIGNHLWASSTYGYPGAYLAIQNDGNLVIYVEATPIWASNTGGH